MSARPFPISRVDVPNLMDLGEGLSVPETGCLHDGDTEGEAGATPSFSDLRTSKEIEDENVLCRQGSSDTTGAEDDADED